MNRSIRTDGVGKGDATESDSLFGTEGHSPLECVE